MYPIITYMKDTVHNICIKQKRPTLCEMDNKEPPRPTLVSPEKLKKPFFSPKTTNMW